MGAVVTPLVMEPEVLQPVVRPKSLVVVLRLPTLARVVGEPGMNGMLTEDSDGEGMNTTPERGISAGKRMVPALGSTDMPDDITTNTLGLAMEDSGYFGGAFDHETASVGEMFGGNDRFVATVEDMLGGKNGFAAGLAPVGEGRVNEGGNTRKNTVSKNDLTTHTPGYSKVAIGLGPDKEDRKAGIIASLREARAKEDGINTSFPENPGPRPAKGDSKSRKTAWSSKRLAAKKTLKRKEDPGGGVPLKKVKVGVKEEED